MKNIQNLLFVAILTSILLMNSCKTTTNTGNLITYEDNIQTNSNLTIRLEKGESFNGPTFVIWNESMDEKYLNTVFITKSYASGIFGHQMKNDSVWLNEKGASHQPAILPYWTHRKGLIDGEFLIPEPAHPFVDGYTGATPQSDFEFKTVIESNKMPYRIFVEVNQARDWNKHWTTTKMTESKAYKHSAQPSIIYSATINAKDSVFYLNPVGHGNPTGENGKLFTNLSTLTTAKTIYKSIKVSIR